MRTHTHTHTHTQALPRTCNGVFTRTHSLVYTHLLAHACALRRSHPHALSLSRLHAHPRPFLREPACSLCTSDPFLHMTPLRFSIPDKLTPNDEPEFLYYLSDGVYGSFASKLLDHSIPAPSLHKVSRAALAQRQHRARGGGAGRYRALPGVTGAWCTEVLRVSSERSFRPFRRPFWWRTPCLPAACGVLPATAWTRWWSTACCPS